MLTKKRICIKINSQEKGEKLWNLLIKIGFKVISGWEDSNKFRFRSNSETYIWVNPCYVDGDQMGRITNADNNLHDEWDRRFDTSFDTILEIMNYINEIPAAKSCLIKVPNQELSAMVQTFLFSKGINWGATNKAKIWEQPFKEYGVNGVICVEDGEELTYSDSKYFDSERKYDNWPIFNAATQMGEIVKFFEKPAKILKPITITIKLNDQHNGVVGKNEVIVGCQKFPITIIDDLVKARQEVIDNIKYNHE